MSHITHQGSHMKEKTNGNKRYLPSSEGPNAVEREKGRDRPMRWKERKAEKQGKTTGVKGDRYFCTGQALNKNIAF